MSDNNIRMTFFILQCKVFHMVAEDVRYGNNYWVVAVHLAVVTLVDSQVTMVAVVDKDCIVVGNLQVLFEHRLVEVLELLLCLNLKSLSKMKTCFRIP